MIVPVFGFIGVFLYISIFNNKISIWQILNNAFWELDTLDRSDPFWNHTNKLATLPKLLWFAEDKLKRNTDVVGTAWVKIAMAICYCGYHLDVEMWKILKDNNSLDVDFLVKTAWIMSLHCWGDENIIIFSKLVLKLYLQQEVMPFLSQLAKLGPETEKWVNSVIKQIVTV